MKIRNQIVFRRKALSISLVVLFFFSLISCAENPSNLFVGIWTIDSVYYQDRDISNEISLNVIAFEENQKVLLPGIKDKLISKKDRQGTWRVDSNGFLIIFSKNQFFDGKATYCFKNNDEELLRVVIQTDSLYLEATKFFSKYDSFGSPPCNIKNGNR
ncbi:hypothetical protein [uncultured Croceitalea sp.]|uniref:hypothetical protein n=1 Tax=uncultured Croceitalea sp. TaxID=1798908 RepID=UPI00374E7C77